MALSLPAPTAPMAAGPRPGLTGAGPGRPRRPGGDQHGSARTGPGLVESVIPVVHRILFAIGDDAASEAAIGPLAVHARTLAAAVRVIYLRRAGHLARAAAPDRESGLRGPLEHALRSLWRHGARADAETAVVLGPADAVAVLLRAAAVRGADIVAVGTYGRSDVGGEVLAGGDRWPGPPGLLALAAASEVRTPARRILVVVDGSTASLDAVDQAGEIAGRSDAAALVLHLPPAGPATGPQPYRFVEGAVERLTRRGLAATGLVGLGVRGTAETVGEVVRQHRTDLVVLGPTRRRDRDADLVRHVVHGLRRPVLVTGPSLPREPRYRPSHR